ncbi:UNVERIFIED_CONTAM: condensation domain-containing protein [Williamsia faeni]
MLSPSVGAEVATTAAGPRGDSGDEHGSVYPLMLSQLGMRNGQLSEPGNPAYSIAMVVWFAGTSDADRVRAAAAEVCREASAVNVVLGIDSDGEWTQTVDLNIADEIEMLDFSTHTAPETAFAAWLDAAVMVPFVMVGSPLLRHTVAIVDDRVAYVAIAHHMVIDGYGAALLQRRLVAVYMAHQRGEPVPAAPFGSLRELVSSVRIPDVDDVRRWTDYLAEGPACVSFSDETASSAPVPINRQFVVTGVRRHGQIWTRLMIAAIAAYVARFTGMGEAVVGVPVSNRRNHVERRTPAMLMTVLPLRVEVSRSASPKELAHRVGRELMALSRKPPQRSEVLREAVPAVWHSGRLHGPIVNILPFEIEVPDRSAPCRIEILNHGPVEDVSVLVAPTGVGDVRVELSMNPRVYDGILADQHIARLKSWLQSISDDPGQAFSEVPFMTSDEVRIHQQISDDAGREGPVTWDSPTSPKALAAIAGIDEDIVGAEVIDDFDQPVPFGRRGRVQLLGRVSPIATELVASVDSSGIMFCGNRGDLRVVNGRTVELGRLSMEIVQQAGVMSARVDPTRTAARLLVQVDNSVDVEEVRRRLGSRVPHGVRLRFEQG